MTPDGDGGYTEGWRARPADDFASIDPVSAQTRRCRERFDRVVDGNACDLMRYHAGVTIETRIKMGGRVFNVQAVRNVSERNIDWNRDSGLLNYADIDAGRIRLDRVPRIALELAERVDPKRPRFWRSGRSCEESMFADYPYRSGNLRDGLKSSILRLRDVCPLGHQQRRASRLALRKRHGDDPA